MQDLNNVYDLLFLASPHAGKTHRSTRAPLSTHAHLPIHSLTARMHARTHARTLERRLRKFRYAPMGAEAEQKADKLRNASQ